MPYAPGVTDRSGEIYGAGLLGAMQTLSSGMSMVKQKRDEHKQLESENKALELIAKSSAGTVGLPPELIDQLTASSADESPRAKNARLKTALTGVLTQEQLQNEQQKRQLMGAQMAQMNAAQERDKRNQAAAMAAVGGGEMDVPATAEGEPPAESVVPEPDEMMRRYLRAGGNDRSQVEMLIAAAKPKKQERKLETITLQDEDGNPVSFAWDGASAPQRITPKPEKAKGPMSPAGKLLADAEALEAAGDKANGKMLRDIAAKQGEDKPMDITAFLISGGKAEQYRDYVDQFRAARKGSAAAAPAGAMPKFGPEFEGKNVRGPDGKTYQIKNGKPVLVQ